jgi:RNA polymerase sigma-70 factor (ECF subfamily)
MVGDRAEAEDLVQVAFARAARRIESFDPAYRLSTWLYRIALNACRDYLKSPRRRERPDEALVRGLASSEAPGDRPDQRLERRESIARLYAALDSLRPSYREILILKDVEERSYAEIREITGSPVTALKIRAIRARAKLAKALKGVAS